MFNFFLEETLDRLIDEYRSEYRSTSNYPINIADLSWNGSPWSIEDLKDKKEKITNTEHELNLKIDMIIHKANNNACMKCSSRYVRECKEWMDENNFKDEWLKAFKESKVGG